MAQERTRLAERRARNAALWANAANRRNVYNTYSSSNYVVTYGNGWRGRGYYYGPPDAPYYWENPGIRFFASRTLIPFSLLGSDYYYPTSSYGNGGGSVDVAVQQELANRGYYTGPIDGDVGPGTRNAIVRYQEDNGMVPTGAIDEDLLNSLQIN